MKKPNTIRFCVICEKITTFEYNKIIMHSNCKECGNRFGAKPKYLKVK